MLILMINPPIFTAFSGRKGRRGSAASPEEFKSVHRQSMSEVYYNLKLQH